MLLNICIAIIGLSAGIYVAKGYRDLMNSALKDDEDQ